MGIGMLFLLVPAASVVAVVVLLVQRKRRAAIIVGAVAAATVVLPMLMIHTHERRSGPPPADAPATVAIRGPAETRASAQADIAFTPPVPRPGVLTIAAPDDFTPWKKTDGLVARRAQAPGEEWVDNAAGAQYIRETAGGIDFIYWKPGPDSALAGYSGLATSPEEARRAAEDSAVQKVAVLGLRASQEKNRSRPAWNAWSAADVRILAAQLARETQCYSVEGTAAQAAERPYGNLFRAAVRVRVEPQGVEALAQRIAERVQSGYLADQERTRVFVLASVGLIVCIVGFFAAYCFLRAGAAGALAWPLRAVALTVLAFLGIAVYLLSARGV